MIFVGFCLELGSSFSLLFGRFLSMLAFDVFFCARNLYSIHGCDVEIVSF